MVKLLPDMLGPVQKTVTTFFEKQSKLSYKKGDVIVRAGDAPTGVLFLTKGLVRQYVISPGGEVLVLHIFRPGAFFPMTWVINNVPNVYFFEAITPVDVRRAPKETVRQFLKSEPEVLYDLTGRVLKGLSGLLERIQYLVLGSAFAKTVSLLVYLAHTIGEETGKGIRLPMALTHRDIASWIGTTRETASIQVEILIKRGLVVYEGRVLYIVSLDKLKKVLGETIETEGK